MPKELKMGSFNPDDFASGRPDDFDGVITAAVLKAWRWPNSQSGKYQLFAGITFQPDDGEEFEENYQAGWLNQGIPSPDGKVAAGGITYEDYVKLGNGELDIEEGDEEKYQGQYILGSFAKTSNFEQFCTAMRECGFSTVTSRADQFVGIRAHFVRLPQTTKMKPKKGADTTQQRDFLVLVPSEIYPEKGKKVGGQATVASAATTPSTPAPAQTQVVSMAASDGNDLSSRIELVIYEAVNKAGDNGLPKNMLGQLMLNNFKKIPGGVNETAEALSFINDPAKLMSLSAVNFNPETGILTVA